MVFFREINGKRFFRYAIMLYLRKYSVLIMDIRWPHLYADGPALFILQFEIFAFFFIPASAFIMTDVLQGKIQQQCKIFLFPKRIPFLFLNLFGWSKSWPRPHTTNAQWRFARLLLKPRFILWPVKSATSYSGEFFSWMTIWYGGYPFHWSL